MSFQLPSAVDTKREIYWKINRVNHNAVLINFLRITGCDNDDMATYPGHFVTGSLPGFTEPRPQATEQREPRVFDEDYPPKQRK